MNPPRHQTKLRRLTAALLESERFVLRAKEAITALHEAHGYSGPCPPWAAAKRSAIDASHALRQINKPS